MALDNENIIEHMQMHTPIRSSGFWLQGIKQTIKLVKKKNHVKIHTPITWVKIIMIDPCYQVNINNIHFPDWFLLVCYSDKWTVVSATCFFL